MVERRHWIGTPKGPVGIVIGRSDATSANRDWLTDHLGSVVGVIDEAGVVKQEAAYGTSGDPLRRAFRRSARIVPWHARGDHGRPTAPFNASVRVRAETV